MTWLRVLPLAAALGPACATHTELAETGDAVANGENGQHGSLYEPCVGHNDASRGDCSAGEICGSMPGVGYEYCMPALPCPTGMVSVIDLACAYPCDDANACAEHGLARCAENTLAQLTGGSPGWCTP